MITDAEEMKAATMLFKEGMKSYLDTLVAIKQFRGIIQNKIRKSLSDKLNEICSSMKIAEKISENDISPYAPPFDLGTELDGNWAIIGFKILVAPKSHYCLYFSVHFNRIEDAVNTYIAAEIRTYKKKHYYQLYALKEKLEAIIQRPYKLDPLSIDNELQLYDDWANDTDLDVFDDKFRNLIDQWNNMWNGVGGLPHWS